MYLVCGSLTPHIITPLHMLYLELYNFVAVLVIAFPIQCVVLRIIVLCFCGGFLYRAWSSSLRSLFFLVANIF